MASKTTNPTWNEQSIPLLRVDGPWDGILEGDGLLQFQAALPSLLVQRRWFGGKGREIEATTISETVPVHHDGVTSYLALVNTRYGDSNSEIYVMVLSFAAGEQAARLLNKEPAGVFLRLATSDGDGVLYDGIRDRGFANSLLELIHREGELPGSAGKITALHTPAFDGLRKQAGDDPEPRVMGAEQSNSSIVFGERLILKLFRRLESGTNPDLEIGQFLTEHGYFHSPPVAGALELKDGHGEPKTLGILQGFVPNQGDAWKYTLDSLAGILDRVRDRRDDVNRLVVPELPPIQLAEHELPIFLSEVAGEYLGSVALLGQRTAELHLTLDSDRQLPNFAPESFTRPYQEAVHRGMRQLAGAVLALLRSQIDRFDEDERERAAALLTREDELLELYKPILNATLDAERIRIHGDYHLGQVLFTGNDFVIIDFEGEPSRRLEERRIKRSPLRDVAGMLRSFDYAGQTSLAQHPADGDSETRDLLSRFIECWVVWTSSVFMKSYLTTGGNAPFLPADRTQTAELLDAFRLDKAVYELGYEINNRPAWVRIPLVGITRILDQHAARDSRRRVA